MPPTGSLPQKPEEIASRHQVPGWSIAVVGPDGISAIAGGVRDATSKAPVGGDTIFEAASLSKPVFAHAVLQLIDEGRFSLDQPLQHLVPDFLPSDARAAEVTARHVLSHTTGLPNWRSESQPLKTYFSPGTRFSYSGEGFVLLQRAVEASTGEALETLLRRLVFEPLGMTRSSYVWRPDFESDHASPHDDALRAGTKYRPDKANSAFSLHATAADFARFLKAVVEGEGLAAATQRLWLRPEVEVRSSSPQCLDPDPPNVATGIAWGLGWGLDLAAGGFFHWGNNTGFKAFTLGSPRTRTAAVAFTNADAGSAAMSELLAPSLVGEHRSLSWVGWEGKP